MNAKNSMPSTHPDDWLTTCQAARFLKCAPGTLANKRVNGGGPPFIKFGKNVFYDLNALNVYLAEQAQFYSSTFDWKNKDQG